MLSVAIGLVAPASVFAVGRAGQISGTSCDVGAWQPASHSAVVLAGSGLTRGVASADAFPAWITFVARIGYLTGLPALYRASVRYGPAVRDLASVT